MTRLRQADALVRKMRDDVAIAHRHLLLALAVTGLVLTVALSVLLILAVALPARSTQLIPPVSYERTESR